jgi:hypothetical protein
MVLAMSDSRITAGQWSLICAVASVSVLVVCGGAAYHGTHNYPSHEPPWFLHVALRVVLLSPILWMISAIFAAKAVIGGGEPERLKATFSCLILVASIFLAVLFANNI